MSTATITAMRTATGWALSSGAPAMDRGRPTWARRHVIAGLLHGIESEQPVDGEFIGNAYHDDNACQVPRTLRGAADLWSASRTVKSAFGADVHSLEFGLAGALLLELAFKEYVAVGYHYDDFRRQWQRRPGQLTLCQTSPTANTLWDAAFATIEQVIRTHRDADQLRAVPGPSPPLTCTSGSGPHWSPWDCFNEPHGADRPDWSRPKPIYPCTTASPYGRALTSVTLSPTTPRRPATGPPHPAMNAPPCAAWS